MESKAGQVGVHELHEGYDWNIISSTSDDGEVFPSSHELESSATLRSAHFEDSVEPHTTPTAKEDVETERKHEELNNKEDEEQKPKFYETA
jgi:hypothetical protein